MMPSTIVNLYTSKRKKQTDLCYEIPDFSVTYKQSKYNIQADFFYSFIGKTKLVKYHRM